MGKRSTARRLAGEVRRRLEPVERALPITLPGRGSGGDGADAAAPGSADARIDAARERLRATIAPPDDDG